MRSAMLKAAAGLAVLAAPVLVHAQDAANYPSRPVMVVVPLGPGGATNLEIKVWLDALGANLGQTFVTDFKPGAGQTLGWSVVAKAKPDGYTLGVSTINFPLAPLSYPNLPYDPMKSFEHITVFNKRAGALIMSTQLPVRNIKEYIAYARAHPEEINYIVSGASDRIAGVWLMAATNTKLRFVNYKNGGVANADLLAGRVHMETIAYSIGGNYDALVSSGKVRNIGTTALQRTPIAPDMPTLHEQGVTDYEIPSFIGLLAPAGTPAAIVNKLHGEVVKISKMPETPKKLGLATIVVANTPVESRQMIQSYMDRYRKLAQDFNLTMEAED